MLKIWVSEPTKSMADIGREVGVSRERVRQILKSEGHKTSWQPIETAPKDRMLLVGFFNSMGKWRSMHAQYRDDLPQHDMAEDGDEPAEAGWYEGSLEAEMLSPVNPKFWMPLPAPPSLEKRGD